MRATVESTDVAWLSQSCEVVLSKSYTLNLRAAPITQTCLHASVVKGRAQSDALTDKDQIGSGIVRAARNRHLDCALDYTGIQGAKQPKQPKQPKQR